MQSKPKDQTIYALYFPMCAMERKQYQSDTIDYCRLSVVTIVKGDKLRNPTDSSYQSFYDLDVVASWNNATAAEPVSWEVLYEQLYYVDLARLHHFTREMERIQKAIERFPIRPTTFGQFCVLLCKALGIAKFVRSTKRGSLYDEGEHQISPIEYAQQFIDRKIEEARKPVAVA